MTNSKFLLMFGPSGVGKSRIINALKELDERIVYVAPYTNRALREGEEEKVSVSDAEIDRLQVAGKLLVVIEKFGYRYATPRDVIDEALEGGEFPVLDWPVERIDVMQEAFGGRVFTVYVAPPSIEVLRQRLNADDRDLDGHRLREATHELAAYHRGYFSSICDLEVVSHEGCVDDLARLIYLAYLDSLS